MASFRFPIDPEVGNTFADCLRAILRQDPDRILVGEIRDLETAEIAVQASLTGHLVFSTLHTNDAPGTITRLKDMGIPTFMITATVEAILAQRLVRRICSQCREAAEVRRRSCCAEAGHDHGGDRRQDLLSRCRLRNLQQHGLQGPSRIVRADGPQRRLAGHDHANCSTDELREKAREFGMITLRDAGFTFAEEGTTTLEEVIRETVIDVANRCGHGWRINRGCDGTMKQCSRKADL